MSPPIKFYGKNRRVFSKAMCDNSGLFEPGTFSEGEFPELGGKERDFGVKFKKR